MEWVVNIYFIDIIEILVKLKVNIFKKQNEFIGEPDLIIININNSTN